MGKDSTKNPTYLMKLVNPILEFYIIQDLNRFLPTFRLKFRDIEGRYSNLTPYDKRQSNIRVTFNRNNNVEGAAVFDFDVYRQFPSSDDICDLSGVLQINNFFKPNKIRGFSGNLIDNISSIAIDELGVDEVDISASLNFDKDFIQSNVSNIELLKYLRDNLIGLQSEAPYFCYITCKNIGSKTKKVLVFKSLKEFYSKKLKYTFSDSPALSYDEKTKEITYPILDYKVYDNYKILDTLGSKQINYSYFDYNTGVYKIKDMSVKDNAISSDDYYSLTEYFSIDLESTNDNIILSATGRGNSFTSDFKGRSKGEFFRRINNLSKFWVTSVGLEDINPGDVVRLQFLKNSKTMLSQQYHGFWMVERVIHLFGDQFGTRLLLTRNGVNSSEQPALVWADLENRKRK